MGRDFRWLWAAYAISAAGTWLALDAFPLIAVLELGASPAEVSLLAAAGLAAGAVLAAPLGRWVEFRPKRPVMVGTDVVRFAALATVPVAYGLGKLTLAHLVAVSTVAAAAGIAFNAAGGAYLKTLVPERDLLTATGRFEVTTWTATALGPPLGGLAIGAFGPVVTVVLNGVSFLLSALGILGIRGNPPPPARPPRGAPRREPSHPGLRLLFLNTVLVNGLILAGAPLLAVLLLRDLGFTPWQYGLAFGVPCLGGLLGSRLARPLVTAYGRDRVLSVAGTLRVCWPVGLAFVPAGPAGLVSVMAIEFGLILCVGVFNPVFAAHRLAHTAADRVARTLTAWSVAGGLTIALLTVLGGVVAEHVGVRGALAVAGVLLLITPILLPHRRRRASSARFRGGVSRSD